MKMPENNQEISYLQSQDQTEYNLVEVDTFETELTNMLNLFKKVKQIGQEKNKDVFLINGAGFFLTDDLKIMNPGGLPVDLLNQIQTLANAKDTSFLSVKLRIAVRLQMTFTVSLKYKTANEEQSLQLFTFALDLETDLLKQKYFTTYFSFTYEI